ncbi:MAG: uroporphyrinogen decarboxylase family protein [Acidobacteriota bacterium]
MTRNTITSRERIRSIIARRPTDRCGFWLGNPHEETLRLYHRYFGTRTLEALHEKLGSDFRWLTPQYLPSTYREPHGKGLFDLWKYKASLGDAGPLADCESIDEVRRFDWPSLEYLHLGEGIAQLQNAGPYYRASGFWMPFFHDVMDLFGMESFLVKLYTHPEVVRAAFDHVCGFYEAANELLFREAGGEADALFFGNDFGTQRDLLLSPEQFESFVLPWITRFARQAHGHGLQVILHSCGAIARIIPQLIDAGIDCLHPLQSRAEGMDAESLAAVCTGRIALLGGIDTQRLLVEGSTQKIKEEVRRIKTMLGPHLIVSPSHEALLPNVPPEHAAAMAEAALE